MIDAPRRRVDLGGVSIDAVTRQECVGLIFEALGRGEGGWLITYNLDILRRERVDDVFAERAALATLRVADGVPLLWAARVQGTPLPDRVAGSDIIDDLVEVAAAEGRSMFLLGGHPPSVCERAAEELVRRAPGLEIAGTYSPPMGFLDQPDEVAEIERRLTEAQPDLVVIALPPPLQAAVHDRFACQDLDSTWWLGLGVTLSFVTGDVKRAPEWMQRTGLEWIHRLVSEPRRLARRYLLEGLPFAARLLATSARRRVRRRSPEPS